MQGPEIGFVTALLLTVAFLVGVIVTGKTRRMRAHVAFVTLAVCGLGVAVYFALRTGELYDLEAAGRITPIHLNLARTTTFLYLWPLVTGPLVWSGRLGPRIHRTGAWLVIALTLASTVTGVWMLLGAERLV